MTQAAVLAASVSNGSLIAPGTTAFFGMSTVPTGWLAADGTAVSRTTYSALFAAIGTTYGSGNGTTTFNLPNLGGQFVRGWISGQTVDSGRVFGSNQDAYLASHSHGIPSDSQLNYGGSSFRLAAQQTNAADATGGDTRPKNVAMLACIKY